MMHYSMGSGMMGGSMLGMVFIWLIWLAIGSFVFSWIFWKTHKMVMKK